MLAWFAFIVRVNTIYIPLVEKPGLVRHFGRLVPPSADIKKEAAREM
jgi:hypothetical protein